MYSSFFLYIPDKETHFFVSAPSKLPILIKQELPSCSADVPVRWPYPAHRRSGRRDIGTGQGGHVQPERLLRPARQRHLSQLRRKFRRRDVMSPDVTPGRPVHARADAQVRESAVFLYDLSRAR